MFKEALLVFEHIGQRLAQVLFISAQRDDGAIDAIDDIFNRSAALGADHPDVAGKRFAHRQTEGFFQLRREQQDIDTGIERVHVGLGIARYEGDGPGNLDAVWFE
ncbi:hypothetical protein D3C76_761330 [compost metagenome]